MRPTRPSHAQQGTQATRETPAKAVDSIPATHFKPHFVVGDGDCLFQALCMGSTNQPAIPVSMEHIMNLRQDAANYVAEHRSALMTHPSFGGEAGVNALYGLLITQGQWNENAGDLVPPILARVLGREIRILEPTHHSDSYDANENRIFRPQDTDTGMPPAKPDTGQPPMYLAHINNAHYEYLEPRDPQADASSLGSTSTTRWLDQLLDEKTDDDNVGRPPSPQGSSFGRVSSLSSLESYSSRGFLEKFTAEEKNSSTEVIGQPPKKRPRHAERRHEQEGKVMMGPTHPLLGKRQVAAQSARNEIKKAFAEAANNRSFDALTKEEQAAEVTRISQKIGYNPSGIRTTLNGEGNKQVRTQAARTKITKLFIEANDHSFRTLTEKRQAEEVTRISRKTGYRPSGVQTTLIGEGNKQVLTQVARTKITALFTEVNDHSFRTLAEEKQAAEVMRISRETGYSQSGVRTTLTGGGNMQVGTNMARNKITKAFTDGNNRPFKALTPEEQSIEVSRVSQKTGYNTYAVRTTLTGGGNKYVMTAMARNEITQAFTKEANNRPFDALTKEEQAAEIVRISRETGYNPSGVQTTLTGGGNKCVRTDVARNEITQAFTNKANNRSFDALTKEEQDDHVTRISRKTGYNPSGVRATLNGRGRKQVQTQAARVQITNAFTEANNRPFDALTKKEQDAEVTGISRKTGYRPSGVRITLTGGGNKKVRTQVARTQITNAFTETNNRPFDALKKEEQDTEVTRISRETGYNPSAVRSTLTRQASARPK